LCCSGFFVFLPDVQLKPLKRAPVLIATGIIAFVSIIRLLGPPPVQRFFERIECISYDMRARAALKTHPLIATNLGFVFIDEESVKSVWNGSVGFYFGLYWPRQVYGRVVDELRAQGATAVAFDVIYAELRPDHGQVQMADGRFVSSDEFFAMQMQRASNVLIAITKDVTPPNLFLTNAAGVGHIATDVDPDGILRRAQAFLTYRLWHPAFLQAAANPDYGLVLEEARVEGRNLVFPRRDGSDIKVPLDDNGNFDVADVGADKLPPGTPRKARPFEEKRAWHMGILLAARELGLDMDRAEVDLPHGMIRLRNSSGLARQIPVDKDAYFYIDWCIPPTDPRLTTDPIQFLLWQDKMRLDSKTEGLTNRWRGKLAVVGSSGVSGNNLTDQGATPLFKKTLLVSKHWNVANSIITGRFVRRTSAAADLMIILFLGVAAAFVTLQFRVLIGSTLVACLGLVYIVFAFALYAGTRIWIPLVLPLSGALLVNHGCLLTWRVIFEQAEKRRIKATFGSVVSPKIMDLLLATENLKLGGTRREITVLFADVRGFTELTDKSQDQVDELVQRRKLTGYAAEAARDQQAQETLNTVNVYLGLVADTILKQDATLDKFIGDCVMAFWGAPTAQPNHAAACVRAAIEAQRAIAALNRSRAAQNKGIDIENQARAAAGLEPKPILPLLLLGTGINTGMATAGLMGSAEKMKNYTVFGREVNLASRLEGLSGRGRIFISQTTYEHLQRDDPALATICIPQEAQKVKGIGTLVKVYDVPWKEERIEAKTALSQGSRQIQPEVAK
jgi:class 3 adenylate cyclase/CHASE2 domain-containing sensor protein